MVGRTILGTILGTMAGMMADTGSTAEVKRARVAQGESQAQARRRNAPEDGWFSRPFLRYKYLSTGETLRSMHVRHGLESAAQLNHARHFTVVHESPFPVTPPTTGVLFSLILEVDARFGRSLPPHPPPEMSRLFLHDLSPFLCDEGLAPGIPDSEKVRQNLLCGSWRNVIAAPANPPRRPMRRLIHGRHHIPGSWPPGHHRRRPRDRRPRRGRLRPLEQGIAASGRALPSRTDNRLSRAVRAREAAATTTTTRLRRRPGGQKKWSRSGPVSAAGRGTPYPRERRMAPWCGISVGVAFPRASGSAHPCPSSPRHPL